MPERIGGEDHHRHGQMMAATITGMLTMPTAVITESSENTMSMTAICRMTIAERGEGVAFLVRGRKAFQLVDFHRALHQQEQAAADQHQVAQRDPWPNS
jgi:hypothetical protein